MYLFLNCPINQTCSLQVCSFNFLIIHIICIEPPSAFLRPALDAKPGDDFWPEEPDSQPREESPFFGEFPPDAEVADTQIDTPEKSPRPAFVRKRRNWWDDMASPPLPSTPVHSHGDRASYAPDDEETKPMNDGLESQSVPMDPTPEEPVHPKSVPMGPKLDVSPETGLPWVLPQVPMDDAVEDLVHDPKPVENLGDGEAPKPDDSKPGVSKPKCKAKSSAKSKAKNKALKPPKVLTEEQKQQKRFNSQIWHTKWVSKGVPKIPKNPTPADAGAPGARSSSSSSPTDLPGSLSAARDQFIKSWIEGSGLPKSNDRRKRALEAWMASSRRAELMAARSGTQK